VSKYPDIRVPAGLSGHFDLLPDIPLIVFPDHLGSPGGIRVVPIILKFELEV